MPREHTDALNRKNIIEKRKEEAERREQDKAREEARYRTVQAPHLMTVLLLLLLLLLLDLGTLFFTFRQAQHAVVVPWHVQKLTARTDLNDETEDSAWTETYVFT